MPKGVFEPTALAFTPQSIRDSIRRGVVVPAEMLNKALRKLDDNLEAKETKFFSFQGSVIDTRSVDALSIQQQAAELIVKMAELVATQQAKPQEPRVEVVIDAKTGTMRIVIGDASQPELAPPQASPLALETKPEEEEVPIEEDDEIEHVKVPRGVLSTQVREALGFHEPTVGSG